MQIEPTRDRNVERLQSTSDEPAWSSSRTSHAFYYDRLVRVIHNAPAGSSPGSWPSRKNRLVIFWMKSPPSSRSDTRRSAGCFSNDSNRSD